MLRCADPLKTSLSRSLKKKKQRQHDKRPPSRRLDTVHQFSQGNGAFATYSDNDDYVVHSFSAFALHDGAEDDKYFTWLPVSLSPEKSIKVLMQVDSAASCNTLPSSVFRKISSAALLKPSHVRIFPGKAIYSLGKVSLPCEGVSRFETLEFQVIDSACIPGKPALISGRDSKRLGLLKFHKNRVFS